MAFRVLLHTTGVATAVWVLAGLVAFALLMARLIGTNTFSLHSMYGNRLTRAYLGASNPRLERRAHQFTGFDPADNVGLAALASACEPADPAPRPPFLVINAALNLVQSSGERLEWQQRKAASFVFTPRVCGSSVLGYAPTSRYARKPAGDAPDATAGGAPGAGVGAAMGRSEAERRADAGGLSIGRAMAISGAAASPNMGYHSSRVVAFAMNFFNVRLGWWLPNPRVPTGGDAAADASGTESQDTDRRGDGESQRDASSVPVPKVTGAEEKSEAQKAFKAWERDEPPAVATLLAEALASTHEGSDFVYLSDGGHFENLGLYEMVRRRCRRIVVVDATQDPGYHHEDLLSAVRKVRIDFGISIVFPRGLPTAASCRRLRKPWALGQVHYAEADRDAPSGAIVYLKPALWDGLPPDILRYAETSRPKPSGLLSGNRPADDEASFPHQSTGDQFFDEAQFESYRLLGLLTVLNAFGEPGRWPEGPGPDHLEPTEPAAAAPGSDPRPATPLRQALSAARSVARRRRVF